MFGLYLTMCLAAAPDVCKEVQVASNVPLQACMVNEPAIVALMDDYPGYQLRGWKCKSGERV